MGWKNSVLNESRRIKSSSIYLREIIIYVFLLVVPPSESVLHVRSGFYNKERKIVSFLHTYYGLQRLYLHITLQNLISYFGFVPVRNIILRRMKMCSFSRLRPKKFTKWDNWVLFERKKEGFKFLAYTSKRKNNLDYIYWSSSINGILHHQS